MGEVGRNAWFLLLVLALILMTVGAAAWAAPSLQEITPAEIEPELQAALQTEGQANLLIIFRDRADLGPTCSMSWAKRGDFVYQTLLATAQRSQATVRGYLDARRVTYSSSIIDNSIHVAAADLSLVNELATFSEISLLRLERTYPVLGVRPEPEEMSVTSGTFATSLFLDGSILGLASYGVDALNVR